MELVVSESQHPAYTPVGVLQSHVF